MNLGSITNIGTGPESIKLESITPKGVTLNGVIAESNYPVCIFAYVCNFAYVCFEMFSNLY